VTHNIVDKLIKQFINEFGDFDVSFKRYKVPDVSGKGCKKYGFCNAYVIKQLKKTIMNH
jgi:hypothetical protein